ARGRRALHAGPAADVEVQLVADDQAAAPRRLYVAPVPVAVGLRDRDEGAVIGPVPVEAVAAEAGAHLVGLGAVFRLAAPDAEQAQQQALVGYAVEVVQLRLHLKVVAPRVVPVG